MSKWLPFSFAEHATVIDLLRYRSLHQPDQHAYIFLEDGETREVTITYRELEQRALTVAAMLQELGVAGERALLLHPPGLEYITAFFGCLFAGVVAVPTYPPTTKQYQARLQAVVADAQATVVLTTTQILLEMQHSALTQEMAKLHWLSTDVDALSCAQQWQIPAISGDTLAFLQYTSGSTTAPKGVMVSHTNMLYQSEIMYRRFEHSPASWMVSWLPPYHDMGLILGILQPLYAGFPATLMSPFTFTQYPLRWLQALSRYKATITTAPNFAYDLCVRKATPGLCAKLNLSSLEIALNGAEPVRYQTLQRFAATFASCGLRHEALYPAYGLAEATLAVSLGHKLTPPVTCIVQKSSLEQHRVILTAESGENTQTLVGCGQALGEQEIILAHPESLRQCADGEVGEILLSGRSMAQGYWQHSEETTATFHAYLTDSGAGPFLRTGDLGFLLDGNLFITGRIKDLVIIRGRNLYPQDIELSVEQSHPVLRPGCGAAFSIDIEGEEQLVIVQEVQPYYDSHDLENVAGAIRQAVAEQHDVQVHTVVLTKPRNIPKTSSGKIQRRTCQADFLAGRLDVLGTSTTTASPSSDKDKSFSRDVLLSVEPAERRSLLEYYLRERVAHVLKVAPYKINLQQSLSFLGLDSLMALELKNDIEAHLEVVLPLVYFPLAPSITKVIDEILVRLGEQYTPILATSEELVTEYTLSYGQRALWFIHQLAPESSAYNIILTARTHSLLDLAALHRSFQMLTDRHPSLRTTFSPRKGEPVQHIHAHWDVPFQSESVSAWSDSQINGRLIEEAHRPFNLEQGPLLRIMLFNRSDQEHILLLVMHHIISDFWSFSILLHELELLYAAETTHQQARLPGLELQYIDYIRWQAEMLTGQDGVQHQAYWKQKLVGIPAVLLLPTDHPRPAVQAYHGASHSFALNETLATQLKELARSQDVTLYTILLAAFHVLLYRYTGQDDILVGSPTAGRNRTSLTNLIGYFVNPVVLRTHPNGNMPFITFLEQVQQTVLNALAHQDYPFALLVEHLQVERDPSHSPIFQVMFVLQQAPTLNKDDATIAETFQMDVTTAVPLQLEAFPLEEQVALFDLMLTIEETQGALAASLQYNTDLFETSTIQRMVGHLNTLFTGIVINPAQTLANLPLLTFMEHEQMRKWCETERNYPEPHCLHQLFEAQALSTPNEVAVTFEGDQLTYGELNCRANQLSHYLKGLEVGPDVLVGICMERSLEMVVGLLGILKAGGAYVPLESSYPKDRLSYILESAQVKILLTQERLVEKMSTQGVQVVCLDLEWQVIAQANNGDMRNQHTKVKAENLAYVIYTSGSTGLPKGVMITHQAICNRLLWMQETYKLTPTDRVLQKTPYSFDVSVWEFFWPLLTGASLVIARPEGHRDSAYLIELIVERSITIAHFVPSMLRVFLEERRVEECTSLRRVICSGEALPFELQQRFFARLKSSLHNLYGPTEAAVDVTFWNCVRESKSHIVPIGQPIANVKIYLLDAHLQPVPIGVIGEIYIGGVCLARGYSHRADLTAEGFIPDPFSNSPGTRLYKTGDLACYLPDGSIEYLGRSDHQVKLRGFRIELDEIASVLMRHPSVRTAVVLMSGDVPTEQHLVAYVVIEQAATNMQENVLRDYLKELLPDYMIPTVFTFLEALPLTNNGKLDRSALLVAGQNTLMSQVAFVAPRTSIEEKIANIWSEILHLDHAGIYDNFFAVGGHSLLAIQLLSRIRSVFQVELPLDRFFKAATIADLSLMVTQHLAEQIDYTVLSQHLTELEQLSEDEVQARLKNVSSHETDD